MPTPQELSDQLVLLHAYRERLAIYLRQLAITGPANARPEVISGIQETRANIRRVKENLRSWNVSFESHPDDEESAVHVLKENVDSSPPSIKTGSNSINIGVGHLTNPQIQIGDKYEISNGEPHIALKRSSIYPIIVAGKVIRTHWMIAVGLIGMILGLVMSIVFLLNFSLQPSVGPLISTILILGFGLLFAFGSILHTTRFTHFLGKNFERDSEGQVYITEVEGFCPKCGSVINIKNVGSNENKKTKIICRRNPLQHSWDFDFTLLPEIRR